ncbi:hypothetical protein M0P98_09120, partial [bacterium]|nr:hypothetical protein [bacterium]
LVFILIIVYSHSFSAFGEIATLRNPSYAKASAGKARKINYKRRNGGLLTKGSALLFPYSEPVKPFGDALCAEG